MSQAQKEPMSNNAFAPLASPFSGTITLDPQQREVVDELMKIMDEEFAHLQIDDSQSEDDDYCHGCETGADAIEAHSDACNKERGFL